MQTLQWYREIIRLNQPTKEINMKKITSLIAMFLLNITCFAQFFPYGGGITPQRQMDAFNYGKRLAEQYMQQQEQQIRSNPSLLWSNVVDQIGTGHYDKAYEYLECLAERHDDGNAYLYLGYMNEWGLGTSRSYSYAESCYENGLEEGCDKCRADLRRIRSGEYLDSDSKINFISYFVNLRSMIMSSTASIGSIDYDSGSSSYSGSTSSSSRNSSCSACGGTRVNPNPNYGGSLSSFVAYYNAQGNHCPYCGKYNDHFHDRCSSCNVPRY